LTISRRDLLQWSFYAAAGIMSPQKRLLGQVMQHASMAASPAQHGPVASLPPRHKPLMPSYVDPLPIPPVIRPSHNGLPLQVRMREFRQKVHRDLRPTKLWGYNGMWPGPTFEVRKGQPLSVEWINQLPTKHFLPIDTTIHGSEEGVPQVRTAVHVHGAQVLPESDGYPDAWVTSDGKAGAGHAANPCNYPNDQESRMLWYHDHAIGTTRLNVHAGLAGLYIIRDDEEQALNLPQGEFEIPLLIQDRSFTVDGSLVYPIVEHGPKPAWMQEFFGDSICVNGKATPYLEVEPRKYRFRIVNGSNARFYHLALRSADSRGKRTRKTIDAPPFHQIGSDGGLLPHPVQLHYLIVGPGERFDLIVDFSEHQGSSLALVNDAPAPYTRGGEVVPSDVMLFKVIKPLSGKDTSSLPDALVSFEPLNPSHALRERVLSLTEMDRPSDGYTMMGLLGGKHWDDPVTEDPKAGSMEIWSFANATGDVHPVHTHLIRFQVLNRQPFDVKTYQQSGKLVLTGIPMPPETNERPAWKDTIKTYPGYITRVIQRFDLPAGTPTIPGQEFRYVWHCHILEHEDNEMMRPYNVIA
jgi:spore coat protein A